MEKLAKIALVSGILYFSGLTIACLTHSALIAISISIYMLIASIYLSVKDYFKEKNNS